jgi:hypothetical protein
MSVVALECWSWRPSAHAGHWATSSHWEDALTAARVRAGSHALVDKRIAHGASRPAWPAISAINAAVTGREAASGAHCELPRRDPNGARCEVRLHQVIPGGKAAGGGRQVSDRRLEITVTDAGQLRYRGVRPDTRVVQRAAGIQGTPRERVRQGAGIGHMRRHEGVSEPRHDGRDPA